VKAETFIEVAEDPSVHTLSFTGKDVLGTRGGAKSHCDNGRKKDEWPTQKGKKVMVSLFLAAKDSTGPGKGGGGGEMNRPSEQSVRKGG